MLISEILLVAMIWESSIWKRELVQDLQMVKKSLGDATSIDAENSDEQIMVAIEKFAFTSAFIIRKLSEAKKLSDELESTSIPVQRYSRINLDEPVLHFLNWHRFKQFYDLDTLQQETLSPRTLCNMLIHSFVFQLDTGRNSVGFDVIYFNSDHTKDEALFEISLVAFFDFVEAVTTDSIENLSFNSSKGIIYKSQSPLKNSNK